MNIPKKLDRPISIIGTYSIEPSSPSAKLLDESRK